jgi:hypothetical protein
MHYTCPAKLSILSVTLSVFTVFRLAEYVLHPSKQQAEMIRPEFRKEVCVLWDTALHILLADFLPYALSDRVPLLRP